ncbi:Crp/Fnr family transcriptional regulator [Sphingomonas oryzagri]
MGRNLDALGKLIKRIEGSVPLDDVDRDALLGLPHDVRHYARGASMVVEDEPPQICAFLLSGWASRQKHTEDGRREIVSIMIAYDFVDLQNIFLRKSDHEAQALTATTALVFPLGALQDLVFERPAVGRALWIDALVAASVYREWLVNLGRRDSLARVAHMLCELTRRLRSAGLADGDRFELPLTQEQVGDVTGLTSVHVNRVLKSLVARGLIRRDGRSIEIPNFAALAAVAGFDPTYLHLDQTLAGAD